MYNSITMCGKRRKPSFSGNVMIVMPVRMQDKHNDWQVWHFLQLFLVIYNNNISGFTTVVQSYLGKFILFLNNNTATCLATWRKPAYSGFMYVAMLANLQNKQQLADFFSLFEDFFLESIIINNICELN